MKIGLLTYDIHHAKTYSILKGLIKRHKNITLIINKFRNYKKKKVNPIYPHRPAQLKGPNSLQLSKKYKLKKIKIEKIKSYKFDYILIGGSGLIKKKFIKKNIINCHSGLIPQSRGLDAFKWAIKNNRIVGNTLHFIDEKADLGKIISHKITPIFQKDTYQQFARRHYQNEINMLINFDKFIRKPNILNKILKKKNKPMLRMKNKDEILMINNFEKFKKKFKKF